MNGGVDVNIQGRVELKLTQKNRSSYQLKHVNPSGLLSFLDLMSSKDTIIEQQGLIKLKLPDLYFPYLLSVV